MFILFSFIWISNEIEIKSRIVFQIAWLLLLWLLFDVWRKRIFSAFNDPNHIHRLVCHLQKWEEKKRFVQYIHVLRKEWMENIVYLHSRHSRRPSHRLVKMKRKSISLNLNAPQILTIPLSWFKLFRLKVCKILSTHLVHIHRIHRSLYLHLLKLRHRDLNIEVYKSSKICIFKFIT